VPLFCRHNRFEASCPICSREKAPAGPSRSRARGSGSRTAPGGSRRTAGVVTRRLARETDDGYRNELVPGVKATADAERLAAALALGAARLEFPGPHPELVEAEHPQQRALELVGAGPAALEAFARWTPPAGDQGWSPERRFARWFDRLRLPGVTRGQRFEFLVSLGAAGVLDVEADALHVDVKGDDAATLAAKRALNSGDAMLLERRARSLAEAAGVPVAALDRGLVLWDSAEPLEAPPHDGIRAALRLPA
jgi:hypothetical protein